MSGWKISEGMRTCSATLGTLTLLMEDGTAVHLNAPEVMRVLEEIAGAAPGALHTALERRLVQLITRELDGYRKQDGDD